MRLARTPAEEQSDEALHAGRIFATTQPEPLNRDFLFYTAFARYHTPAASSTQSQLVSAEVQKEVQEKEKSPGAGSDESETLRPSIPPGPPTDHDHFHFTG